MNSLPSPSVAITVTDLVKDFGGTGLLGASLTIPDRGVTAIIGPNGAGKTTLFTILAGLVRQDSGHVTVDPEVGRVAYCPDTPAFERWLTATEVLDQSATLARAHSREPGEVILDRCGLGGTGNRWVGGFSRGMTQRLGIASTLVIDPRLMILDEPTSALDPVGRREVLALLAELGAERSVVLSSHSLADVEKIADTIIILAKGRVVYQGTLETLLHGQRRPVWRVRVPSVSGETELLAQALAKAPGVEWCEVVSATEVSVRMDSIDRGERTLPRLLAETGLPVTEMVLERPDLDDAFAAIVSEERSW